jgi:hypothetical protein
MDSMLLLEKNVFDGKAGSRTGTSEPIEIERGIGEVTHIVE